MSSGSVADVLEGRAQWGMAFGCSRQVMRSLPPECVHVACTSPPYWGLRAYSPEARPAEIGREKTPGEYIDTMVDVGRAVRHVLRQDGVWILNLGDTYAGAGYSNHRVAGTARKADGGKQRHSFVDGICDKSLLLIPSRVALALQADGWIVRSAVPWIKLNAMPESVTDRLTVAHETVFVLVRSKRYFWDADAVRMGVAEGTLKRHGDFAFVRTGNSGAAPDRNDYRGADVGERHCGTNPAGRNLRTSDIWLAGLDSLEEQLEAYLAHVRALRERKGMLAEPDGSLAGLLVNPVPYTGAHFAAYPPRLIAPLIRAASSERGCCPHCGAQWVRDVERGARIPHPARGTLAPPRMLGGASGVYHYNPANGQQNGLGALRERTTLGFSPACSCPAHEPIPAIVLDPFGGSGTTSQVARALGLRSILVDLYEKHAPLIRERMATELDPAELKPIPRPDASQEDDRQLAFAI